MPEYRNPAPRLAAPGLLLALLLAACSTPPLKGPQRVIRIDSEPPGAQVYASGRAIGTTPLRIDPGEYFSTGARFGSQQETGIVSISYVGTLEIKKPGCRPYVQKVDDYLLSRDILATLECGRGQASGPEAPLREGPPAQAEQRLRRIEDLHEKGLLSDEEYRSLRERVLETL